MSNLDKIKLGEYLDHIAIGNVNGLHMLYLLYSIFSFVCVRRRILDGLWNGGGARASSRIWGYYYVCFVDRSLSFWPLCCLFFFNGRILITPLVSSNSSFYSSVVNSRFKPWFCKANDYDIGIYCFSATHVALKEKETGWLGTRIILCSSEETCLPIHCCFSVKIQLSLLV